MHVGVFLDDKNALAGGGYTFIHDILAAFLETAGATPHKYTLFCPEGYAQEVAGRLPKNVVAQPLVPRNFVERAIAELRHTSSIFSILYHSPCRLERVARSLGVELMWFVGGAYDTPNMPYFTTVWDLQHRTHPWFPEITSKGAWEHREAYYSRHLGRAARVIVGTEVGKNELARFYGVSDDRICILPHPTPKFALTAADVSVAPPRGMVPGYFFYPAQFWPHKNHANLLRGYRLLCDRWNDAPSLVFSGSEQQSYAFIRQLVKELSLEERVHFLGFVTVDEIIALYRNAVALVYPSFSGPENLPPLEAFALGCPVAASAFPGAHEQLEDAAVFFDPRIPASIADALQSVSQNTAYRAILIEKGHARASCWTSAHFVQGVFAAIDAFVPERGAWGAE